MEIVKQKEVTIRLLMENAKTADVTIVDTNDGVNQYRLPVKILAGMLDAGLKRTETMTYERVGRMPEGYLDMCYGDNHNFSIACMTDAAVYPYHYTVGKTSKVFMVPFPKTMFLFQIRDGKVVDSKCNAVNQKNKICYYPFPNVYENGKICWGGNILPEISRISDIHSVMDLFVQSGFNTHLYTPEVNTTMKVSIEELLRYLEPLDEFPNKILIEKKGYPSIREYVDTFLRSKEDSI